MSIHLKLKLYFKIQYFWCAQMIILSISDFGVSIAILNPVDISPGGASWALDLCETRLNHAIFLNRQARGDHIFTFDTDILE